MNSKERPAAGSPSHPIAAPSQSMRRLGGMPAGVTNESVQLTLWPPLPSPRHASSVFNAAGRGRSSSSRRKSNAGG